MISAIANNSGAVLLPAVISIKFPVSDVNVTVNELMGFLNISHHRKLKGVKSWVLYGDTLIVYFVVYINVVDAYELL